MISIPRATRPRLNAVPRQTEERKSTAGECRECRSFCDKLVNPAGCLEMGCKYLYTYEDVRTGGRYMGCMNKVFGAEINFALFLLAERTREGFGGIKMTGEPLPHCQFSVERAYEGDGPAYECVTRGFVAPADEHREPIRASALRIWVSCRSGSAEQLLKLVEGVRPAARVELE